ncbi:MAG: LON peptidase substrate-binding domain-containing protein [Pseudonocardia sp.]|nr:LON peptidase substrate-binding domain-containing protein [Pseudonocardia sp.]
MAATVPLFPLGTVLMPGTPLPLHIFEPRYRRLTVDLVTGAVPDKEFGVVAVREGFSPDADGMAGLHPVGCTAELRDVRRHSDGRYDIVTRGSRRFRLLEIDDTAKPYLVGRVEFLPDTDCERADLTRMLMASAREAHRRYCATAWKDGEWDEPEPEVEAGLLAYVLAADCLLPMSDRQSLLEQVSPTERLRMIRLLLARETGLLTQLHAVPAPVNTYGVAYGHN